MDEKTNYVIQAQNSRPPIPPGRLDDAKNNAKLCQESRILVWDPLYGGGYYDTKDTTEARQRVGQKNIVAEISWDGFVEKNRPAMSIDKRQQDKEPTHYVGHPIINEPVEDDGTVEKKRRARRAK
jgi:hypothetical protein